MSSGHDNEHSKHPSTKQYIIIAFILFVVTAIEFVIILPESMQGTQLAFWPLIVLSLAKFYIVIMFYMHLRFDNPLLTKIFYGGLGLGVVVAIALLGLYAGITGTPREYASERAVPYEGHYAEKKHGEESYAQSLIPTPAPVSDSADTSGSSQVEGNIEDGELVFSGSLGCVGCHTMEDLPGAVGVVGPNLSQIGTVAGTRSGLSAEDYIRESIDAPAAYVVEGYAPVMPELRSSMSDQEYEDLIAYLVSKK
tara:strand:+ start:4 stop:759 length:756 start_codon:yes stop_codon:yes gene_type:complete